MISVYVDCSWNQSCKDSTRETALCDDLLFGQCVDCS